MADGNKPGAIQDAPILESFGVANSVQAPRDVTVRRRGDRQEFDESDEESGETEESDASEDGSDDEGGASSEADSDETQDAARDDGGEEVLPDEDSGDNQNLEGLSRKQLAAKLVKAEKGRRAAQAEKDKNAGEFKRALEEVVVQGRQSRQQQQGVEGDDDIDGEDPPLLAGDGADIPTRDEINTAHSERKKKRKAKETSDRAIIDGVTQSELAELGNMEEVSGLGAFVSENLKTDPVYRTFAHPAARVAYAMAKKHEAEIAALKKQHTKESEKEGKAARRRQNLDGIPVGSGSRGGAGTGGSAGGRGQNRPQNSFEQAFFGKASDLGITLDLSER